MSAPNPTKQNWSIDDHNIEAEFSELISVVEDNQDSQTVPASLDRKIKRIARGSVFDELEKNWIFSGGARLTAAVLVFFAIAMLWISL